MVLRLGIGEEGREREEGRRRSRASICRAKPSSTSCRASWSFSFLSLSSRLLFGSDDNGATDDDDGGRGSSKEEEAGKGDVEEQEEEGLDEPEREKWKSLRRGEEGGGDASASCMVGVDGDVQALSAHRDVRGLGLAVVVKDEAGGEGMLARSWSDRTCAW